MTPDQQRRQAAKRARNQKIGNVAGGAAAIIWIVFGLMLAVGAAAFFTTDTIPSYGPMTTAHAQQQCVEHAERQLSDGAGITDTRISDENGNIPVEIQISQINKTFTASEARDISDDAVFNHATPITHLYGARVPVRVDDRPATLFCVVDMDAAEDAYEAGERDLDPNNEILAHIE